MPLTKFTKKFRIFRKIMIIYRQFTDWCDHQKLIESPCPHQHSQKDEALNYITYFIGCSSRRGKTM